MKCYMTCHRSVVLKVHRKLKVEIDFFPPIILYLLPDLDDIKKAVNYTM